MAVSYHGIYENSIQIRTATGDNSESLEGR